MSDLDLCNLAGTSNPVLSEFQHLTVAEKFSYISPSAIYNSMDVALRVECLTLNKGSLNTINRV